MVQYSMKMHQIVTTRFNNLQYHSLLRLNSNRHLPVVYWVSRDCRDKGPPLDSTRVLSYKVVVVEVFIAPNYTC